MQERVSSPLATGLWVCHCREVAISLIDLALECVRAAPLPQARTD